MVLPGSLATFLTTISVVFNPHICRCEITNTKALETFTNFRFPVLSGVPIVPAKQITLRLIYVLINPVVTFQPAEHKLYND